MSSTKESRRLLRAERSRRLPVPSMEQVPDVVLSQPKLYGHDVRALLGEPARNDYDEMMDWLGKNRTGDVSEDMEAVSSCLLLHLAQNEVKPSVDAIPAPAIAIVPNAPTAPKRKLGMSLLDSELRRFSAQAPR